MPDQDLYATLGVPRDADADAIKKAYRKLAVQFHPDKNPGDKRAEERFKKINHANEVLSDPKKRALFDEFGEVGLREGFDAERARQYSRWHSQSGQGPDLSELFNSGDGQPVDFSSVFERFFGGKTRRGRGSSPFGGSVPFDQGFGGSRGEVPGSDLEGEVTVEFTQSVRGAEIGLNVNGSTITVRIPPGASEGSRVRIHGKGLPSASGGPPGDLLLTIHVRPHKDYWIEDGDLHIRVPITAGEAFKGAKVRIPTPGGEVVVKVAAHSASGTRLRVRGKGVPATRKREASDLIAHLQIVLPDSDAEEVKSAIETLEGAYKKDIRADLHF